MKPISLGSRDIYIHVNEWQTRPSLHIRKYFMNKEKVLIPRKFGITLNEDEFKKLFSLFDKINNEIEKIKETNEKQSGLCGERSFKRKGGKSKSTPALKKRYSESTLVYSTDSDD